MSIASSPLSQLQGRAAKTCWSGATWGTVTLRRQVHGLHTAECRARELLANVVVPLPGSDTLTKSRSRKKRACRQSRPGGIRASDLELGGCRAVHRLG